MTGIPGNSHSPRLFAPGVGLLLGYVVLIGSPLLNRDLRFTLTDSDSALLLVDVMVFYPSWQLDVDTVGPFLFWTSNLRTILFVGLAMAGLIRVSRWLRENADGTGVFAATVGVIALSAVAAAMTSAVIVTTLLDTTSLFPTSTGRLTSEYFLGQLSSSAAFGVVFGLVLGAVVVGQRRSPSVTSRRAERVTRRPANAPKSFW